MDLQDFFTDEINDLFSLESGPELKLPEVNPQGYARNFDPVPTGDHLVPEIDQTRPTIIDPLTDKPYEPINTIILDMMMRGNCGWCFYSIPGTLYWLSHTTGFNQDYPSFKLDCTSNRSDGPLIDRKRELQTHTRLFTRWLMTQWPAGNDLATIRPDGSVLLSHRAQLEIFVFRLGAHKTKGANRDVVEYRNRIARGGPSPYFDWEWLLSTEPQESLSLLWIGVLPTPQEYKSYSTSEEPPLPQQSERIFMSQPYSAAAHEQAQQRPLATGARAVWRPHSDHADKLKFRTYSKQVIQNSTYVDPFLLEKDGRTSNAFDHFMEGKEQSERGTASYARDRDDFWRARGLGVDADAEDPFSDIHQDSSSIATSDDTEMDVDGPAGEGSPRPAGLDLTPSGIFQTLMRLRAGKAGGDNTVVNDETEPFGTQVTDTESSPTLNLRGGGDEPNNLDIPSKEAARTPTASAPVQPHHEQQRHQDQQDQQQSAPGTADSSRSLTATVPRAHQPTMDPEQDCYYQSSTPSSSSGSYNVQIPIRRPVFQQQPQQQPQQRVSANMPTPYPVPQSVHSAISYGPSPYLNPQTHVPECWVPPSRRIEAMSSHESSTPLPDNSFDEPRPAIAAAVGVTGHINHNSTDGNGNAAAVTTPKDTIHLSADGSTAGTTAGSVAADGLAGNVTGNDTAGIHARNNISAPPAITLTATTPPTNPNSIPDPTQSPSHHSFTAPTAATTSADAAPIIVVNNPNSNTTIYHFGDMDENGPVLYEFDFVWAPQLHPSDPEFWVQNPGQEVGGESFEFCPVPDGLAHPDGNTGADLGEDRGQAQDQAQGQVDGDGSSGSSTAVSGFVDGKGPVDVNEELDIDDWAPWDSEFLPRLAVAAAAAGDDEVAADEGDDDGQNGVDEDGDGEGEKADGAGDGDVKMED